MALQKKGYPEDDELVLCIVTKIFHHGVFAHLEEYGSSGMIHISEISPGRIRNIGDYVKEGKKIVCKVLKINKEKGQIDLSLRRVNEGQKREKINEVKQEQRAEKIIEFAAKTAKKKPEVVKIEVHAKISKKYLLLHECFEDVVRGTVDLEKLGIEKSFAKILTQAIQERMKPTQITVLNSCTVKTYDPNGVKKVQEALQIGLKQDIVTIRYAGGGRYTVTAVAEEYKEAEKIMESYVKTTTDAFDSFGSVEFVRIEK
ncbi:MAG: S1 RNA-binding domain-containing protein [Nanoarchaeota archaeon]|nr:S1 RNA-binding domain-containing protein [Nanoarchaeota archaeon]